MTALTEKQADAYMFIKDFIAANKYPPTRSEIAEAFDIQPTAAQARLEALIKKGAVTVVAKKGRSIVPVKGYRMKVK